ncbi:dynein arm light chain, putative [Bodo saltans]|uniref:Dynein arm light chain, putative n=1 Tax=Bodo saltans TaxID=75058 RepID=A0A0S4JQQ4_BODSA|nr:dynein arm light chain, putative [Bodo saltans]|eukprot:CUG93084.1 dynein arm light chain, putative [Bodo saltans]
MYNPYSQSGASLVLRERVRGSTSNGTAEVSAVFAEAARAEEDAQGITVTAALARIFPETEAGTDAEGFSMVDAASTVFTDRMSVIHLQDQIDKRCTAQEARPFGVDPIREGIYADGLAELIRQVTVLCPERGLLLNDLREEMQETNSTYDLLFESACQYATRKGIERDVKRTMQKQLQELTVEVRTLENRVHELHAKYEGIDKRFNEQRAGEEKVHQEEVTFLKKGNLQLTTEIKRLTM